MSPTVSPTDERARLLADVSVVSTAVEAPELGARESIAAGAFRGVRLGERLNEAVASASGRFVLLLGEGATPGSGAIEALAAALKADETLGATCGRLVAAGRLLEAGGIVWGDGTLDPYGRDDTPTAPAYAFARDVDYGSAECLLVRREAFVPFDPVLESLPHLGADLCLRLAAAGRRTRYVSGATTTVALARTPIVADETGLAPSAQTLERLRPQLVGPEPAPIESRRVLVIGVYLATRLSNVRDSVRVLGSEQHTVVQRWVALGGEPPTPEVAQVTAEIVLERTPKYVLLNRVLEREDLSAYDTVIVSDDDVVFPEGFLDRYLATKTAAGFALAQPARTRRSYVDHPIVLQQRNLLARRTHFVEIGPVVSFDRRIFDLVFPHDVDNEMGWGFEQVWAHQLRERSIAMGIVDGAPVDHSIRKPVEHYDHARADAQRRAYLAANQHLELPDCFRVLDLVPVPEAA